MPTDLVTIVRINQFPTKQPGLDQFTIDAECATFPHIKQYVTVNAFRASLCQRALELKAEVQVTWKDSRFGKDIVQVSRP